MNYEEFQKRKKEFLHNFVLARPIMTVLGNEVRQEIILNLIESGGQGGLRVGEIQKRSNVSRSSVSHHMKVLLDAGIIRMRREGTKNYYYIDFSKSTILPVVAFFQEAESMLKMCTEVSKEKNRRRT